MKKLFIYLIVLLPLVYLNSCSSDDDDDFDVPELTLANTLQFSVDIDKDAPVYDESRYAILYDPFVVKVNIKGHKIAIDWGDGTVDRFYSVQPSIASSNTMVNKMHKYASGGTYTIKIWSEGLTSFRLYNWGGYLAHDHYQPGKKLHIGGANNLKELAVYNNKTLTGIDLSGCPNLEILHLDDNGLETLDLSKLKDLKSLDCGYNNFKELNIEKNTKLEFLGCQNNQLDNLDVSKNTKLALVSCSDNNLSADALNKIFTDLPASPRKTKTSMVKLYQIYMIGNPGSETCDVSIIKNKGWRVIVPTLPL